MTSHTRILIVDDLAHVRRELSTILGLTPGLEVVGEAADGLEAVRQAEALHPDVVLMDLVMPGLDGIEATRQIKRRGLARSVVVLTLHGGPAARDKAAQAGADAFVEKGTDITALVEAIRRAAATS
jgi:NarL family two-component system response regulator LiaR